MTRTLVNKDTGKEVRFKYPIKKVIRTSNCVFVLLDVSENENATDNIYCLTSEFDVLWRVKPLSEKYPDIKVLPYVDMTVVATPTNNQLYAFDMYCRRFHISMWSGDVMGYEIEK